jgi:hypothetical protein
LGYDFSLNITRKKWYYMASKVLIKNPKNGRQAWFSLPLYFGKLSVIGMSGSYDDQIEIVDYEGSAFIGYGLFSVANLEQLNRQVEG